MFYTNGEVFITRTTKYFSKRGTIKENIIFERKNQKADYELLIKGAKTAHIYELLMRQKKVLIHSSVREESDYGGQNKG